MGYGKSNTRTICSDMLLRFFSLSFSCAYSLWHLWHTLSFTYSFPPLSFSHVLTHSHRCTLSPSLTHFHTYSLFLSQCKLNHSHACSLIHWLNYSVILSHLFSLIYSHPLSLWFPPSHSQPQLLSLTFNPLPLSHSLYPSLGLHSSPSLPLFITWPLLHTFSHSITFSHSLPKNTPSLFLSLQLHSLSFWLTLTPFLSLLFPALLTLPYSHPIFHSLLTHSFTLSLSLSPTFTSTPPSPLSLSLILSPTHPQNIKAFRSIVTMGCYFIYLHSRDVLELCWKLREVAIVTFSHSLPRSLPPFLPVRIPGYMLMLTHSLFQSFSPSVALPLNHMHHTLSVSLSLMYSRIVWLYFVYSVQHGKNSSELSNFMRMYW